MAQRPIHHFAGFVCATIGLFTTGCCLGQDCGPCYDNADPKLTLDEFSATTTSPERIIFPGSTVIAKFDANVEESWCGPTYNGTAIDYTLALDGIHIVSGQVPVQDLSMSDTEIAFSVPAAWAPNQQIEDLQMLFDSKATLSLQISDHATTVTKHADLHNLITVENFYSSSLPEFFGQVITTYGLEMPACIAISSPTEFRYNTEGKLQVTENMLGSATECKWDFGISSVSRCNAVTTFSNPGSYPVSLTLRYPPVEVTGTVEIAVVPSCAE